MTSTAQQPRTATPSGTNASSKQRGTANGVTNRNKSSNEPRSPMRETTTPDKHAHDRLLFLIANMVGQMAQITVKSGERYTGVLSGASLPKDNVEALSYVLKMTKKIDTPAGQANGHVGSPENYIGYGEDHIMTFSLKDVVDVNVSNLSLDKVSQKSTNGTSAVTFRTDADISGNLAIRERELQAWQPGMDDGKVDMSLNGRNGGAWDQFETNERLYGVKTDYDETFYTTAIDRSAASYKERAAAADRLAREIEGVASSNPHVAEERGQANPGDNAMDEEDRFSGVRRDSPAVPVTGMSNRYQPPAKRAPTGQTTVFGAPVDPAIISSQLARPESAKPSKAGLPQVPSKKEDHEPNGAMETASKPTADGAAQPEANMPDTPSSTTKTIPTIHKESSSVLDAISPKANAAARAAGALAGRGSATANVERNVLNSFRNFAAHEKLRMMSKQKMTAQKEREVKLNDLKKFATNFKLKTAVPTDMLGILARDKEKQTAIMERSKRQLEEQHLAPSAKSSEPTTPSAAPQTPAAPRVQAADVPAPSTVSAVPDKNAKPRGPPLQPVPQSARQDRTAQSAYPGAAPVLSPRGGAGHLGQRLMAQQQQYRDRGAVQSISSASGASAATPSRQDSVAGVSRFNVQAMEFRPNPAAATFSPSQNRGSVSSPDKAKPQAPPPHKPTDRVSFFGDKRPTPTSEKPKLRDSFNPIARMKKEVEAQGKTKDFSANGGIPQAYRTPPIWDASEENKEKSWRDMLDKAHPTMSASPANGPMPHYHQLPLHLQGGQAPQHLPGQPLHGGPTPLPMQGRDHRFDDHRMQFSPSQSSNFPSQSSNFPSPRMNVMMPYPNGQMGSPMQQQFGQPMAPYAVAPNGQPMPFRPFPSNAQYVGSPGGHFAAPMALTQSNMGAFVVNPQMHGMPSPAQGHGGPNFFPGHGSAPHGFPSPRPAAPMMMQQGSQQGHVPGQFMYMGPNQQMYPQHQPHAPHMRGGGVPMMHQNSFGGGPPHFQRQYSSHGVNSFNHQSHAPQSPMAPQAMPLPLGPPQPTPTPAVESADGAK